MLIGLLFSSLTQAVLAAEAECEKPSPKRPNIIFLFSDDHACHAISAYGSKINKTPNIDRIAREGALFSNNFCGNSICGPSRATVLTGLHTHANGMMTNRVTFDGSQQTFPRLLQKAGYTTAMIGKWHLRSNPTGFDYWDILPGQGDYYNPVFINAQGKRHVPGYVTDVTTDLGLAWLKKQQDSKKPFLLMLQHKAPHRTWMPGPQELGLYKDIQIPEPATLFDDLSGRGPAAAENKMTLDRHMHFDYDLQCPSDGTSYGKKLTKGLKGGGRRNRMSKEEKVAWAAAFDEENKKLFAARLTGKELVRWKYQRYIKNYLRCVAGVDRNIGRVLDYLEKNGLAENTIVVYSSDQGFYLGDHGWYDKRWMYEESLRMPLVMRWPKYIKPGTKVKALTQNIDFAPTLLEAAGASPKIPMHGQSLLSLLDKDPKNDQTRKALYYHYYEGGEHRVAKHYGVRDERYKLIYFYTPKFNYFELYDLEKDPQELKNVYKDSDYAEVVKRLKKKITELRKQYKDTTGPELTVE